VAEAAREYRYGSHTIYDIKHRLVWVTEFRHKVLVGDVGVRVRDVIRQVCMAKEIRILKGHVSRDHVHLRIPAPPGLSVSQIVQYIKGKSSDVLQGKYPALKKRFWGQQIWARGYFCASSDTVTDTMIKAYIEQQDMPPNDGFTVADEKF
jgi:putative transposase